MSETILVVNGPNLGLLGIRQPALYGNALLSDIIEEMKSIGNKNGCMIHDVQSNSEGDLIDFLNSKYRSHHAQSDSIIGIIANPGGLSHTSISLRDAIEMFTCEGIPLIEVHLSNILKREKFRHHSYLSSLAHAVITGLGAKGYLAALEYLIETKKESSLGPHQ